MPGYAARIAFVRSTLLVCFLVSVMPVPQPALGGRAQSPLPYVVFLPFVRSDSGPRYVSFIPFARSDHSSCLVIAQTPPDGSFILASSPFTVTWTLGNLSNIPWSADSVRILYWSGVVTGSSVYNLPYDISPGSDFEFRLSLTAPQASGEYASYWKIAEGQESICMFHVLFRVP